MTSLSPSLKQHRAFNNLRVLTLTAIATARSTPLKPLGATAITALVVAMVAASTGDGDYALMGARFATTALAVGVAFALDDPASTSTGAVPHQLRYRRLNRLLYAGGVWGIILAAVLGAVTVLLPADQSPPPIARLLLEASGQAAAGIAIAALLSREDPRPGRVAAGALLGAVILSWLLPSPMRPWLHPEDPLWHTGQWIWTGVLVAGLGLLTLFSWDSRSRGVRTFESALAEHLRQPESRDRTSTTS